MEIEKLGANSATLVIPAKTAEALQKLAENERKEVHEYLEALAERGPKSLEGVDQRDVQSVREKYILAYLAADKTDAVGIIEQVEKLTNFTFK